MKDFTEYKYRIYSYLNCGPNTNIGCIRCWQQDQKRISNIVVLRNQSEYEDRIYTMQTFNDPLPP